MHTQYNRIASLKSKIGQLEKEFSNEKSEEKRKWIFWEIEKAYRGMNEFVTSFQGKKNL